MHRVLYCILIRYKFSETKVDQNYLPLLTLYFLPFILPFTSPVRSVQGETSLYGSGVRVGVLFLLYKS